MVSIRQSSTVVVRCLESAGVQRDNAICTAWLPKKLRAKRGFSVEHYEIVGANNCLFDAVRKSMNGISVIDSIAKTRMSTPIPRGKILRQVSEELHTTKFHLVDSNDVLAMLLHTTNSCKWAAMASTVLYLQQNT